MTDRAERQLAALVEAGMSLSSELDVEALLQRIADLSREVIGASYGAVGVLDESGELKRFVYSGIDEETVRKIGDLPRGKGLLGTVVREGRPLRVPEISEHPSSYGFPPNHPPMHTFLGVPVLARGRVFGNLYLTEKRDGKPFTEQDAELARLFGGRVSEEHRRNVTAWWCEVMGGPDRYTTDHGGYEHMLAKHRGLAITPELRLRFVTLLSRAADLADFPDDPEFRAALMGYAEWGTRLALHNSQPGADVAEHAPVPPYRP
jgi:hemoglobin